jgi:hypothetical protein
METIRKPFQGVKNIVQFNWHFYVIALFLIFVLWFFKFFIVCIIVLLPIIISLLVSFYVYDYSNLYQFKWLKLNQDNLSIANINAGFDETSEILKGKFPNSNFQILDFYDASKHTEISIKRARKKYPNTKDVIKVTTDNLNLKPNSLDMVFLIFSAHEIRNDDERIIFFNQIHKGLKSNGTVYVLEHMRDFANFTAYNIGFFHFLSKKTWINCFDKADLKINEIHKINPFITLFTLTKNGNSA